MTSHYSPSTSFLLTLTLFTLWTFISAQFRRPPGPNEVLCGISEGPPVCYDTYDPVCVPSPKECLTTPCYQFDDVPSKCLACGTPGITSYIPGPCQFRCEPINLPRPDSEWIEGPVCAYYLQYCRDALCRKTFERSTLACRDPGVVFFSFGVCPEDMDPPNEEDSIDGEENLLEEYMPEEGRSLEEEHSLEEEFSLENQKPPEAILSCDGYRHVACSTIYNPVCITECVSGECRKTVENACIACLNANVLSYTPGACEQKRFQCHSSEFTLTTSSCTLEFNPVCGYSIECTEDTCGETARNPCEACMFQQKDYYIMGRC